MLIKRFVIACILLVASNVQAQFDSVIVFGDSLSDNGNLRLTGAAPFLAGTPYDEGRFSNGSLALELVAESLSLPLEPSLLGGTNFSFAGATAVGESGIDLRAQLESYFSATEGQASASALYVIFIGGNDIRNTNEMNNRQAYRTLSRSASLVRNAARRLIDAGANSVVVINSSDIGAIPETALRSIQSGNLRLSRQLSLRSSVFNLFLKRRIRRLQQAEDAQLVMIDLFEFFTSLNRNAEDLGYENSADACFVQTGPAVSDQVFNPACDFDEFLFFDAIHPTAMTHQRAALFIQSMLPDPN